MSGAAYLSKSPDGVYYARFVVPVQQLAPGVSREFRLSTRTKDPRAARALARHLRTCYEQFLLQNVQYTRASAIAHLQAHMPKKPDNLPMPFGVRRHADGGWELTNLTAAELFGTTPAAKPKGKVKTTKRGPAVVKYQDEVGNTWGGGKGPRPAWVKAIQGAGGDIEKYLVVDAQKAAAQRLAAVGGEAPDMADIPRRKGTE